MNKKISQYIDQSIKTKEKLKKQIAKIEKASEFIANSLVKGGKLIIFGNGGSAADAQHIAAEFIGNFRLKRNPLPAMALTTNSSTLTAIGNDIGFDMIFSRQINAFAKNNDVVLAISTSGNSSNVIKAVKESRKKNLKVISLTGEKGGKLSSISNLIIKVPSFNTQHIQESHIMIGHILVDLVEKKLQKMKRL